MKKKAAKKAATKKSAGSSAVANVVPGIVFMGCGMTQEKTDKFAAAMRRKLGKGK